MRIADAPAAGWFPDPQNRSRLRWWDGTDWSDIYRAPPSDAELQLHQARTAAQAMPTADGAAPNYQPYPPGYSRQDSQQLIAEVRQAARDEVDRAAELFSQRARTAVNEFTPVISDYASSFTKWVRRPAIIAIVLLIAYFVFQVTVQASFFEWLGDRIDNLTDEDSIALVATSARLPE